MSAHTPDSRDAEIAQLRADLNDARANWEAAAEELRQADARRDQLVAALADRDAEIAKIRAAFHVNMLRAFPGKSHAEISAEIDKVLGDSPTVVGAVDPGETGINGPLTDAQRMHARSLYRTLHHLGPSAMEDVVRYASVCGYVNGRKDFAPDSATANGAAGVAP